VELRTERSGIVAIHAPADVSDVFVRIRRLMLLLLLLNTEIADKTVASWLNKYIETTGAVCQRTHNITTM